MTDIFCGRCHAKLGWREETDVEVSIGITIKCQSCGAKNPVGKGMTLPIKTPVGLAVSFAATI